MCYMMFRTLSADAYLDTRIYQIAVYYACIEMYRLHMLGAAAAGCSTARAEGKSCSSASAAVDCGIYMASHSRLALRSRREERKYNQKRRVFGRKPPGRFWAWGLHSPDILGY
jgi:hypothetical protein